MLATHTQTHNFLGKDPVFMTTPFVNYESVELMRDKWLIFDDDIENSIITTGSTNTAGVWNDGAEPSRIYSLGKLSAQQWNDIIKQGGKLQTLANRYLQESILAVRPNPYGKSTYISYKTDYGLEDLLDITADLGEMSEMGGVGATIYEGRIDFVNTDNTFLNKKQLDYLADLFPKNARTAFPVDVVFIQNSYGEIRLNELREIEKRALKDSQKVNENSSAKDRPTSIENLEKWIRKKL
jgi:hypothetical protein